MKLRWRHLPQLLLATLALLYLGDWLLLALRPAAQTSSSVQVDQFLKTPLKGQKEEYDYMGTVSQSCVASLFPHRAQTPCWWLERHKTQWLSS
jgi:hypothetical protein